MRSPLVGCPVTRETVQPLVVARLAPLNRQGSFYESSLSIQDYFTRKVCSVGKSDRCRDVTQGNPLRPSEWGFKIGCFPNIYVDFYTFSCFSLDTEDQISNEAILTGVLCILTALDLCNFQQYCIALQWVKESSRRGDVTAKAAAEW